jgi:6-phosphogluconolactonase
VLTKFFSSSLPLAFLIATAHATPPAKQRVYVGTMSARNSEGIYLCEFDPAIGALDVKGVAGPYKSPGLPTFQSASFLAFYPGRSILYAVSEVEGGAVLGFHVDPSTGNLKRFTTEASQGSGPCHLAVDATGADVLVANYGSGSIAVLPIDKITGELKAAASAIQHRGKGVNADRQEGPHAHQAIVDPANRFAFVCNLGCDKIFVYRFNAATGKLEPNDPQAVDLAPGSGPRHLTFDPSGRYAYVINELKSTITGFRYDANAGTLHEFQTISTLPEDFSGNNTTAEIAVHPSGKFLYGSNRGHDSIAIFAVDAATGRLTLIGHEPVGGHTPRHFTLDPTGSFLLAANQDSDNITVHRLDPATGRLTSANQEAKIPGPMCVLFAPTR